MSSNDELKHKEKGLAVEDKSFSLTGTKTIKKAGLEGKDVDPEHQLQLQTVPVRVGALAVGGVRDPTAGGGGSSGSDEESPIDAIVMPSTNPNDTATPEGVARLASDHVDIDARVAAQLETHVQQRLVEALDDMRRTSVMATTMEQPSNHDNDGGGWKGRRTFWMYRDWIGNHCRYSWWGNVWTTT